MNYIGKKLLVADSGDLTFTKTDSLCYDMLR